MKIKICLWLVLGGLLFFSNPLQAETADKTCSDYTDAQKKAGFSSGSQYVEDILYPLEVPLGTKLIIKNLPDYILTIYNFAVAAAGILAVVVIMYGGLVWASSAGNEQTITSAKETILSAIIGLIIILGSYTLLNYINPQLLNLKYAEIPIIGGIPDIPCADAIDTKIYVPLIANEKNASINIGNKGCPNLKQALDVVVYNLSLLAVSEGSTRSIEGTGSRTIESQNNLRMCYCHSIMEPEKKCENFSMGMTSFDCEKDACNQAAKVCDGNNLAGPHLKGIAVDVSLYKDATRTTGLERKQKYNSTDYTPRNCQTENITCDPIVQAEQKTLKAIMLGDASLDPDPTHNTLQYHATGLKALNFEYWHYQLKDDNCSSCPIEPPTATCSGTLTCQGGVWTCFGGTMSSDEAICGVSTKPTDSCTVGNGWWCNKSTGPSGLSFCMWVCGESTQMIGESVTVPCLQ